uniref:Secretory protein n=1 Tax=Chilobrachys guangxiensis TaxID=278060 RepID=B1P1J6_CHIGU|nr:secretory protein [Chilobrachys guangxiensis]
MFFFFFLSCIRPEASCTFDCNHLFVIIAFCKSFGFIHLIISLIKMVMF